MKLRYLLGTLIFCCTQYAYTDSAETKPFKFRDHFHFKQLFTGSWNNKDQIGYSAISTLSGPFDLAVRGQFTGFQPRPLWEDFYAGRIDAGAGIYHQRTGTRLLAGKLETWGLATRTRTVWIHALPWFEVHKPSGADLRTVYVASAPESIYLNLISPEFDLSRITSHFSFPLVVSLQNAALFNEENYFFLQGSSTAQIAKHHKFRFEWCYTEKSLPERRQSTWFSEKRYLPVREIRFYAFNLMYAHPWVGFSTDFACSEIFAWGEDFYLNGGVRIGKRPWRLSFAADGAGMYYSGENGVATGAGMRIGGKFEWNGKKNMRLSLESRLRSESIEHPFDRSVSKISFYFPVMRGYLVTPSRFMISLERDAVLYEHITDTVTALFGLKVGPFRSAFKTELTGITRAQPGDFIIPYPNPFQEHDLSEVKASGELSWPVSIVTLKGTIACRASAGKESVWDKSIMATVRWSWGRVTAKLFSGDKDGGLNYYFSWRFEKKF